MVVWWIKRDFRLADNAALHHALSTSASTVLAVFILEPSATSAPETSYRHTNAQLQAFQCLSRRIQAAGGHCAIFNTEVIDALELIHKTSPIEAVVSHEETGLLRTFNRDIAVNAWCAESGIERVELRQTGVFRRLNSRTDRGKLWNDFMQTQPLPEPDASELGRLQVPSSLIDAANRHHIELNHDINLRAYKASQFHLHVSDTRLSALQPVGEQEAHAVLTDFLHNRSIAYSGGISSPNTAFQAGSRLSVHLAWGTISARTVLHALLARLDELGNRQDSEAKQFKRSLRAFMSRLHWRDHFVQRLESAPDMEEVALNPAYDKLPTCDDAQMLNAWQTGHTGFPIVDACVRCAEQTGFLNFRMRSLITSVATHCFRFDWRDIHFPMAQWWTDYEPGIHIAQLQMQAGVVGINTLRVYSPFKQLIDQDPEARFVKQWVPELRGASAADIASHHEQPVSGYVQPLVSWHEETKAMKADYYAIRHATETKDIAAVVLEKHGSKKPRSGRTAKGSSRQAKRTSNSKQANKATSDDANPDENTPVQQTLF